MRLGRVIVYACVALVALGAYAVWKPEAADRWSPQLAGVAHGLHDRIWPPSTQGANAAESPAGRRPST